MILSEEFYFEITFSGEKQKIKQLVKFLKSGELDDFLEVTPDFLIYCDQYATADDSEDVELVFSNDDYGIELDEIDTDEFLDIICKAGAALEIRGHLYDINDDEYSFVSPAGSADFSDARSVDKFNDELDEVAYDEESIEE